MLRVGSRVRQPSTVERGLRLPLTKNVSDVVGWNYEHMFDTIGDVDDAPAARLRWRLTSEEDRESLFAMEALADRHVGVGEYRGMEFLHVNARSIINSVPASSRMPFRHTINVYRGCSHACAYCFASADPRLPRPWDW